MNFQNWTNRPLPRCFNKALFDAQNTRAFSETWRSHNGIRGFPRIVFCFPSTQFHTDRPFRVRWKLRVVSPPHAHVIAAQTLSPGSVFDDPQALNVFLGLSCRRYNPWHSWLLTLDIGHTSSSCARSLYSPFY